MELTSDGEKREKHLTNKHMLEGEMTAMKKNRAAWRRPLGTAAVTGRAWGVLWAVLSFSTTVPTCHAGWQQGISPKGVQNGQGQFLLVQGPHVL